MSSVMAVEYPGFQNFDLKGTGQRQALPARAGGGTPSDWENAEA